MLVIEDDAGVAQLVAAYAVSAGWEVETAGRVDAGLAAFARMAPDVVVLDIMLPDGSGLDALAAIRARSDAYVVLLTARGGEADRIVGLSRGADDYVVKPFSPGELMARCQALLRRPRGAGAGEPAARRPSELRFGDLRIDPDQYRVELAGQPVTLTALEMSLLLLLARQPGRVFTRAQLVEGLWAAPYEGYDRVIDVHVGHLRRKLGDDPEAPRFIETVRGVGYRFRAAPA